jgi:hypothetical protein
MEQQQCVECSSCKHSFHQQCTGLSSEEFNVLLRIASASGWVCHRCRDDLRLSIAKDDEELSDIRVSLAWLWEELQNAKKAKSLLPDNNSTAAITPPVVRSVAAQPRATELEVHRVLQDSAKRKLNVVVTGLPEGDNRASNEQECATFTQFCEENLSVKPPLAQRGCIRIGERVNGRPRKLLVHLTSEQSAASLLSASKSLQRTVDTRHFYINPDLSPAEAQLAYEQRQKRRAAAAASSAKRSAGRSTSTTTTTVTAVATTTESISAHSNLSVTSAEFHPAASDINAARLTSTSSSTSPAPSASPPVAPNTSEPDHQPFH